VFHERVAAQAGSECRDSDEQKEIVTAPRPLFHGLLIGFLAV
jgi:hypothetical protein